LLGKENKMAEPKDKECPEWREWYLPHKIGGTCFEALKGKIIEEKGFAKVFLLFALDICEKQNTKNQRHDVAKAILDLAEVLWKESG